MTKSGKFFWPILHPLVPSYITHFVSAENSRHPAHLWYLLCILIKAFTTIRLGMNFWFKKKKHKPALLHIEVIVKENKTCSSWKYCRKQYLYKNECCIKLFDYEHLKRDSNPSGLKKINFVVSTAFFTLFLLLLWVRRKKNIRVSVPSIFGEWNGRSLLPVGHKCACVFPVSVVQASLN